jgi:transcriptional regulator with XRE-family HTH domain
MKLVVDLGDADSLGTELVRVMKAKGMVMKAPKRVEPWSVAELAEVAGVSGTTIQRLVEGGVLERVKHVGRVLVTAQSVARWFEGKEMV